MRKYNCKGSCRDCEYQIREHFCPKEDVGSLLGLRFDLFVLKILSKVVSLLGYKVTIVKKV